MNGHFDITHFFQMYKLNIESIKQCVKDAVPHIHQHIMSKMYANVGFPENPKAVDNLTKLVTLGLDSQTRYDIERELISASELNYDAGLSQLKFIRSCAESISLDVVEEIMKEDADVVWKILDEICHRDGTLFLRFINEEDFKERQKCKEFAEFYGVVWA